MTIFALIFEEKKQVKEGPKARIAVIHIKYSCACYRFTCLTYFTCLVIYLMKILEASKYLGPWL